MEGPWSTAPESRPTSPTSQGRSAFDVAIDVLLADGGTGAIYRGVLAPGYRADINLIDHDALQLGQPKMVADLPAGGKRLVQRPQGYRATIVAGTTVMRDSVDTGARPGQLVRGARPQPA